MRRVCVILAGCCAFAAQPAARAQSNASQCVIIIEAGRTERLVGSEAACGTRLSPASTYKIPHALIGLETGAVTTTTMERWDETPHQDQPKWNQDHTVLSAMRPSVLWFFQRMAPRIGAARAREWLTRWNYGNADTSGPITLYWVNGRLRVSPAEQVAFLERFYHGDLGVAPAHSDAVRQALEQAPGTVENARGVHALDAQWRDGMRLNSKTGATSTEAGERVSWLVGRLTVDARVVVFASAVWRKGSALDGLAATELAITAFRNRGVLAARR